MAKRIRHHKLFQDFIPLKKRQSVNRWPIIHQNYTNYTNYTSLSKTEKDKKRGLKPNWYITEQSKRQSYVWRENVINLKKSCFFYICSTSYPYIQNLPLSLNNIINPNISCSRLKQFNSFLAERISSNEYIQLDKENAY